MMREVMQELFGFYEPLGEGMAGVDFEYIGGVALFAIMLIGLLKLLRVVIK